MTPARRRRPARMGALATAVTCLATLPAGAGALGGGTPIVIDDLSVGQPELSAFGGEPPTQTGYATGAGILGGERDLTLTVGLLGIGGALVAEDKLSFLTGGIATIVPPTVTLTWDGTDASPAIADAGLGSVDLTAGGTQDAVRVRLESFQASTDLRLAVGGPAGFSRSLTIPVPVTAGDMPARDLVIPFAALQTITGAGGDPAAVGHLVLDVRHTGLTAAATNVLEVTTDALVRGDLTASLVADADGDGAADPGDEIQVQVVVANPDDGGDFAAPGIGLTIAAPAGTAIVPASVQGSAGVSAEVPAPGTVRFGLGTIADAGQATAALRLRVLPAGAPGPIAVRGTIASDGLTALPTNAVQLTGAPNTAPATSADAYAHTGFLDLSVPAPGVLGNDADPDGDPLTAVLVTPPARGIVSLAPNGSFVYIPTLGLTGPDSFTYRASDGRGGESLATVTVTTSPQVVPPATPSASPRPATPTRPIRPDLGRCDRRRVTIVARAGVVTRGTRGADVILGTAGPDTIISAGGDDVVCGLGGADRIVTGAGDDRVLGGAGADSIDTGPGDDFADGGPGDDRVLTRAGRDVILGGTGNDEIIPGAGVDRVSAGSGADLLRLRGDAADGADIATGGKGRDLAFADRRDRVSGVEVVRRGLR